MHNINVCYFGHIIQIQISTLKFKIFKVFFYIIIIKKTLYVFTEFEKNINKSITILKHMLQSSNKLFKF